jgi:hypothetical protein
VINLASDSTSVSFPLLSGNLSVNSTSFGFINPREFDYYRFALGNSSSYAFSLFGIYLSVYAEVVVTVRAYSPGNTGDYGLRVDRWQ